MYTYLLWSYSFFDLSIVYQLLFDWNPTQFRIADLFFISGLGYAGYKKNLGQGLGLAITSEKPFLEVIYIALLHIKDILDEMCDDTKHQMTMDKELLFTFGCKFLCQILSNITTSMVLTLKVDRVWACNV